MTAWLSHVKAVKANNKGMSLKQVLQLASKTYKKQSGGDAHKNANVKETLKAATRKKAETLSGNGTATLMASPRWRQEKPQKPQQERRHPTRW